MILETFDEKEYIDMVREDAREEGHEAGLREGHASGKVQAFLGLVQDGLLEMSVAAERAGLSVEEFEKLLDSRLKQG